MIVKLIHDNCKTLFSNVERVDYEEFKLETEKGLLPDVLIFKSMGITSKPQYEIVLQLFNKDKTQTQILTDDTVAVFLMADSGKTIERI